MSLANIDLSINEVQFGLGDVPDPTRLASARCKKAGFFMRGVARPASDQTLFWSKNCTVECFGSEFVLCPDYGGIDHRFLCGTSAFLFFGPVGLEKIMFQVFGSQAMVVGSMPIFVQACASRISDPDQIGPPIWGWTAGSYVLVAETNLHADKAWFHWSVEDRSCLPSR